MTTRRLRAYREPKSAETYRSPFLGTRGPGAGKLPPPPGALVLDLAPGHYDGDGCTFPDPDHLIPEETPR